MPKPSRDRTYGKWISLVLPFLPILLISATVLPATVHARPTEGCLIPRPSRHHELNLISGKSMVVETSHPIARVAVGNPEIADYLQLSPRELYLTGKSGGTTNIIIWQGKDLVSIYNLNVTYDLTQLKKELFELLPEEPQIQVIRTQDNITLSGKVSTPANLTRALALARSFVPEKGNVINLMEVGGVHQVMLEVRLAELSRSTGKQLGIDFSYGTSSGNFGVSMLGGLQSISDDDSGLGIKYLLGLDVSSATNFLFRFHSGGASWTTLIDALKEDGLAKVLAEPTLIAMSGQKAGFLAGGKFPVPVPDEDGLSIEFKEFGVELNFTPTVITPDKINIMVRSGVSELDFSAAIQSSGYVVPGLTVREAQSVVELGDGQSFALAGLIRESTRENAARYPFLGQIPILGALFRSSSFQKDETELVIIVTPHLVKPMETKSTPLPTDFYQDPTDMEFFFNYTQKISPAVTPQVSGILDGAFGHSFSHTTRSLPWETNTKRKRMP